MTTAQKIDKVVNTLFEKSNPEEIISRASLALEVYEKLGEEIDDGDYEEITLKLVGGKKDHPFLNEEIPTLLTSLLCILMGEILRKEDGGIDIWKDDPATCLFFILTKGAFPSKTHPVWKHINERD